MPDRLPVLPPARIEIWLTPKNPLLLIFGLLICLFLAGCMLTMLVLPGIGLRPFPADSPTNTPVKSTKTKTPKIILEVKTKTSTPRPTTSSPTRTRTPRPSLTPTNNIWDTCNASYESRLEVGQVAYVSDTPPLRNRLRKAPGTDEKIIGYIDPGERVEILDGPSCTDRWVWWKVKSLKNGEIGWTSEGDDDNYWLVPVK